MTREHTRVVPSNAPVFTPDGVITFAARMLRRMRTRCALLRQVRRMPPSRLLPPALRSALNRGAAW